MIKICSLNKKYKDKVVLDNLNLNITSNTIQGLVGSNGAGKTTLFDCMYKLCSFDGKIEYSKDLKIGYMPTEMFFYSNMKGVEFIEFTLVARNIKVNKPDIEVLNQIFELPLNKYATEYSTGMKKRLILMSILLQKNNFYLLDEPFNGLDLSSVIILKEILLRLKAKGNTILISSHIISSLTDICDSIAYLNKGHIQKTYNPENYQIIQNEIVATDLKDQLSIINEII